MQLQNFECQIAKAQIGRYVAGDALSEEAVRQLEAHIAKCPECKQNLAERRSALQAMLTTPAQDEAPVEAQPEKKKFDLAEAIRAKIQARMPSQSAEKPHGPKTFTKPALYSVALGVVLIGMSVASRNMDSMLGPKVADQVSDSKPAETPKPVIKTAVPPAQKQTPAPKPTAEDTPPQAQQEPTEAKPKVAPPEVEISSTPAPAPKREHKRKRSRSTSAQSTEENVIRVYEPENKP